ncbi:MAG: YicC/YloC family endoribonuclease [Desulfonatronovibrionaceae bacterium]
MTGYGRAAIEDTAWGAAWEIKSVNSKFLDIKWRTPQNLLGLQAQWEQAVRSYTSRGRVEVWLNLRFKNQEFLNLNLDQAVASRMLFELKDLAKQEKIAFAPDLNRLLNVPSAWKEDAELPEEISGGIIEALKSCLKDWDQSRIREGEKMAADIDARLSGLRDTVKDLKEMAGENIHTRFEALKSRLEKTMRYMELKEVDETRVHQELAIMSDRLDVSEELTRLESHLQELARLLENGGEIGRRLDFLLQECFREINTCGNKCQNSSMSRLVVDFKAELEKCREQAQNLE